jgi:unsaturated rhamnogalacturonyl hydrolase
MAEVNRGKGFAAVVAVMMCSAVCGAVAQEAPPSLEASHGTILLDAWYNSQTRPGPDGKPVLYHYKWDDTTNTGYSIFGQMWRAAGVTLDTLTTEPTEAALKRAQYYMIVSPDIPAKNPNPHYMTPADAAVVEKWVKRGGTLLLMENDPANADIVHMDLLADRFGLHFNNVLVHHVVGDDFPAGRIDVGATAPFNHPHVLYMKDTCSLALSKKAAPLIVWKGDTLMAWTRSGKGMVVAVTDPWLYNEYTDGKKLPPLYDQQAAGQEFVEWVVETRVQGAGNR